MDKECQKQQLPFSPNFKRRISFFPLTCFTDRFHMSNDELFEVKLIFDRKTEKN